MLVAFQPGHYGSSCGSKCEVTDTFTSQWGGDSTRGQFLLGAHRNISIQSTDLSVYQRGINTCTGAAKDLKKIKEHRNAFTFVNSEAGRGIEQFSICSDPHWLGAKNTPCSLVVCIWVEGQI